MYINSIDTRTHLTVNIKQQHTNMTDFPTEIRGFITRLYPHNHRLYFHTSADRSPYGSMQSDYNFINYSAPNFRATYKLLLKAAEHKWIVVVKRADSMRKHIQIDSTWTHYNVDFLYVDFRE